jgi:predicted hydrocarbon binding protein
MSILLQEPSVAVREENTGRHNYYSPEDFIQRDLNTGVISLADQNRAAQVSESFITGLHAGIDHEVGNASGYLMYRAGYEWGLRNMANFSARMRQEFGSGKNDIWTMNKIFVWESWWWPLTTQGFGGWALDLKLENKGIVVAEIFNSAVAQSMERAGKPVCHMYAGMFAGAFSYYDRRERSAIEIQCYAMGNGSCKFLIGDSKDVDAAEFWRTEGASAAEVVSRLRD